MANRFVSKDGSLKTMSQVAAESTAPKPARGETAVILNMLKDEIDKAYQEYLKCPGHGRRSLSDMQEHFHWFLKEEWCLTKAAPSTYSST